MQVLNKVDTLRSEGEVERLLQWAREHCAVDAVVPTSALTGRGVYEAKQWAASQMPLGPLLYPEVSRGCFSQSFGKGQLEGSQLLADERDRGRQQVVPLTGLCTHDWRLLSVCS